MSITYVRCSGPRLVACTWRSRYLTTLPSKHSPPIHSLHATHTTRHASSYSHKVPPTQAAGTCIAIISISLLTSTSSPTNQPTRTAIVHPHPRPRRPLLLPFISLSLHLSQPRPHHPPSNFCCALVCARCSSPAARRTSPLPPDTTSAYLLPDLHASPVVAPSISLNVRRCPYAHVHVHVHVHAVRAPVTAAAASHLCCSAAAPDDARCCCPTLRAPRPSPSPCIFAPCLSRHSIRKEYHTQCSSISSFSSSFFYSPRRRLPTDDSPPVLFLSAPNLASRLLVCSPRQTSVSIFSARRRTRRESVNMGNVSSKPDDQSAALYLRDQNRCVSSPAPSSLRAVSLANLLL